MTDRIVVKHEDHRQLTSVCTQFLHCRKAFMDICTAQNGFVARLLNDRAVRDRIGKRYADLYDVRARCLLCLHDRLCLFHVGKSGGQISDKCLFTFFF